jgi:uncharacterized membrane protein HdeD (DUF308 family)
MPPRSLVRAFLMLYVTLGLVVCLQSVLTIVAALHGGFSPQERPHALVLGSLEAGAAVLFLIPRSMPLGAALLLGIFAIAFGLHLLGGHPNYSLLIYAAAVLFIRVHGVRGYRWSASAV